METLNLASETPTAVSRLSLLPEGTLIFGNLVKAGTFMFNPADVEAIDFEPADGCGAEIQFRSGEILDLTESQAESLAAVLLKNC